MRYLVRLTLCALLTVGLLTPTSALGLANWPDRPVFRGIDEVHTVVYAEGLHLITAEELEYSLGIPVGSLTGLTLTGLPSLAEGLLTLDGVEAPCYERLSRTEVDRLVFEPADVYIRAKIAFIPEYGDYQTVVLNLRSVPDPVVRPTLYGEATFTLSGMTRTGQIAALAHDGSRPAIMVVSAPTKGQVHLSGDRYTYTPNPGVKGSDRFTLVAVDDRGVYSEPCTIAIDIETYRGVRYADLGHSPYEPEATCAAALGLFDVRRVGLMSYFEPEDTLTGAAFLEAAFAAAELAGVPEVANATEVVAAAAQLGVVDSYHFDGSTAIVAGDAIEVVYRMAGVPVAPLQRPIEHADALPVSAIPSYVSTNAAGLLPNGAIPEADAVITRDYAAALIYNLYQFIK